MSKVSLHRRVNDRAVLVAVIVLMLATLTACSSFDVVNTLSSDRAFTSQTDIAYGAEARQTLNIYLPRHNAAGAPVVLFFYGGGWRDGSKDDYTFVASALARAGIAVVIPDYRLYPAVTFPEFVTDAALAARWLQVQGAQHGLGTDRIYLMGHSAGAHIAAMLATDPRYLRDADVNIATVAAWIGLSGPYDFLPLGTPRLKAIFPEPTRLDSQPIRFVTSATPPALLIHGDDDDVVYLRNSVNMAEALREHNVAVELKTYSGVGHARVVAALAPPLRWAASTFDDVVGYIKRHEAEIVTSARND